MTPTLPVTAELDPRLRPLLDALPAGVVVFDAALRTVHANVQGQGLRADDPDLPRGLAALAGGAAADWESDLRGVLHTGRARQFDGLAQLRDDGAERVINVLAAPLGSAPATLGVLWIEDVTPRRALERRLAASERLAAVGKLCATVAHELNNPLDGILRFLNLALRVAADSEQPKVCEYVSAARDGTQRLVQIVRALLAFSRSAPTGGAAQDISQIIEESVRTMEAKAGAAGVAIVCHFQRCDLRTIGAANLFQVFCNLIQNAIDAMPGGGTLAIRSGVEAGALAIVFEDTGPGLPADVERLFEPFYTTKPPGKGTGLGLAVSRDIVERCGGRLVAGNRRDRTGAAFAVSLPLPRGGEGAPGGA
ncbi:MAG: ATP-binding protein [Phycisphaerae bacterium]